MRRGRPPHPGLLTPREQEVLSLLREGLTNQQIAERLGISLPGARYHVSEILSKLGVSSRQEAAELSSAGATSRPRWAYGILAAPFQKLASMGVAKGVAAGALFVAGVGVLLLALGVFTMNHRANGGIAPALCGLADETEACQLGKVAYVQNGDVWVKQLPNGTPQRLTTDGHDYYPKWSASGKWLLYRKVVQPEAQTESWVMRSDGTSARQIETNDDTAWSPTNDVLAYIDDNGDLAIQAADGSNQRTLVQHATSKDGQPVTETLSTPLWSPDGKTIAFSRWRGPNPAYSGLWRVDVDSGAASELVGAQTQPGATHEASDQMIPAKWSEDSQNVYFWHSPIFSASIQADGVPLEVVPAAGGNVRDLGVTSLTYSDFVDVADDSIAVASGGGRESWTRKTIANAGPNGTLSNLTVPATAAISPEWSPDGSTIAYVAASDAPNVVGGDPSFAAMAQRRIWLVAADGSSAHRLTSDGTHAEELPQWSKDSRFILFVRPLNSEAALNTASGSLQVADSIDGHRDPGSRKYAIGARSESGQCPESDLPVTTATFPGRTCSTGGSHSERPHRLST